MKEYINDYLRQPENYDILSRFLVSRGCYRAPPLAIDEAVTLLNIPAEDDFGAILLDIEGKLIFAATFQTPRSLLESAMDHEILEYCFYNSLKEKAHAGAVEFSGEFKAPVKPSSFTKRETS